MAGASLSTRDGGSLAFVSTSSLRQVGAPTPVTQVQSAPRHLSAQPGAAGGGKSVIVGALAMAGLLRGTRQWKTRGSRQRKRSATVCLFAPAPDALPSKARASAEDASRAKDELRKVLAAAAAVAGVAFASNPALADEVLAAAGKVLDALPDDEVAAASAGSTDWFTGIVKLNCSFIAFIDEAMESKLGLSNVFGFAIIIYTLIIKALTFPLTSGQMRSSTVMKMIQPKIDQLNKKYKGDQEAMNRQMLRLYDDAGVNPLAGCLPTLIQIPVFFTLYRSIQSLAEENDKLKEPFLWIPSLAGPQENGQFGADWILKSKFEDHYEPLIGWNLTPGYLLLPILLMVSQYITLKDSQTKSQQEGGPAAALTIIFPLLIGYTGFCSPQGVGIYWLINNISTKFQSTVIQTQLLQEFPEYAWIIEGRPKPTSEKTEAEAQAETLSVADDGFGAGSGFGSATAALLAEEKAEKSKKKKKLGAAVRGSEESQKRKAKKLASKRRR